MTLLARLCDALVRQIKRWFPPQAELEARGGGPALDRTLDLRDRRDDNAGALRWLSDVLYPGDRA